MAINIQMFINTVWIFLWRKPFLIFEDLWFFQIKLFERAMKKNDWFNWHNFHICEEIKIDTEGKIFEHVYYCCRVWVSPW